MISLAYGNSSRKSFLVQIRVHFYIFVVVQIKIIRIASNQAFFFLLGFFTISLSIIQKGKKDVISEYFMEFAQIPYAEICQKLYKCALSPALNYL